MAAAPIKVDFATDELFHAAHFMSRSKKDMVEAGGAQWILALSDRVWFRSRPGTAVVAELTDAERTDPLVGRS